MTRTTAREIAVHFSYELSLSGKDAAAIMSARMDDPEYYASLAEEYALYADKPDQNAMDYLKNVVGGVSSHFTELDAYIEKYAVGWKFERISRVAAAIMRVAMYEIFYMQDIPAGAAANEAVEIAKKYETEETVSFINGILGSFIRNEVQP